MLRSPMVRASRWTQGSRSDERWRADMPRQRHQLGPPDYAILGLLMLGPRHGYELLPYFSRGGELGLVCTLGTPRLYAILHTLEELELVTGEPSPPSSGPPRKVFSLTDAGDAAFRRWLSQPI